MNGSASVSRAEGEIGEELAQRLLALTSLRSVSRQEQALADFLEGELRALPGVDLLRTGDNLVVTLRATSGRPRLLFCGHLDTVPENGNLPPRREGDRIHGLGTSDLKSGLAVLWRLIDELGGGRGALTGDPSLLERLRCDPVFVFYAREEIAFAESGLLEVERAWPALREVAFAICVEPTANAVELGCLGTLHADVTVRGKAAHAARPWLGRNAIHAALPLLSRIAARAERRWSPTDRPDLLYREVMSVTGIQGGKARNVIPDSCTFNINFRFAPDRPPAAAQAVISDLVGSDGELTFRDLAPAGRVPAHNAWCEQLIELTGEVRAKQAWTDVGRFSEMGVDAVSCGPGFPEQAHQQGEYASIEKMVGSRQLFRRLLGIENPA